MGKQSKNEHLFTYNLKSFTINEYRESIKDSSAKYKHLNVMMSVLEQKNCGVKKNEINYDEPAIEINSNLNSDLVKPILISAYYNDIKINVSRKPFPEDLSNIIIAYIDIRYISSYFWKIKAHSFEVWDPYQLDPRSLSPLFVYCASIIFFVDLSGYNEYIFDKKLGKNVNRLVNDLNLFEDIIANKHETNDVIIFFNKNDLFREKIKSIPLIECELFSDFDEKCDDVDESMWRIMQSFSEKWKDEHKRYFVYVLDSNCLDTVQKAWWDTMNIMVKSSLKSNLHI